MLLLTSSQKSAAHAWLWVPSTWGESAFSRRGLCHTVGSTLPSRSYLQLGLHPNSQFDQWLNQSPRQIGQGQATGRWRPSSEHCCLRLYRGESCNCFASWSADLSSCAGARLDVAEYCGAGPSCHSAWSRGVGWLSETTFACCQDELMRVSSGCWAFKETAAGQASNWCFRQL